MEGVGNKPVLIAERRGVVVYGVLHTVSGVGVGLRATGARETAVVTHVDYGIQV